MQQFRNQWRFESRQSYSRHRSSQHSLLSGGDPGCTIAQCGCRIRIFPRSSSRQSPHYETTPRRSPGNWSRGLFSCESACIRINWQRSRFLVEAGRRCPIQWLEINQVLSRIVFSSGTRQGLHCTYGDSCGWHLVRIYSWGKVSDRQLLGEIQSGLHWIKFVSLLWQAIWAYCR